MISGSIPHKRFNFPAGEMHVVLEDGGHHDFVNVVWSFQSNDEIVELLLYCNAITEANHKLGELTIPYFPFSRQDRVATPGDAFSLKVMCNLINSLDAKRVVVYDAHSDVLPALLKNLHVVKQEDVFYSMVNGVQLGSSGREIVLISPDAGAMRKTMKVAECSYAKPQVVMCSKKRDPKTGNITGTAVHCDPGHLDGKICIIVDDICDGGRTFTEIAKAILASHIPAKIILMVTHGLFTKGLGVFDGLIDEVYTRHGKQDMKSVSKIERRAV